MAELAALGAELRRGVARRQALAEQIEQRSLAAASERSEQELLAAVVQLLSAMQKVWAARFQEAVGSLVSEGLAGVFGEEMNLVVEMGQSGDLPTVKFSLRDSRGLETDVLDARGGGLVNVASFLLRMLLLLSARPPQARLLFLDESFANVSEEYVGPLSALLRRLCEEGGFQIVLVTHRPALAAAGDYVYQFSLRPNGTTAVKTVKTPEDGAALEG